MKIKVQAGMTISLAITLAGAQNMPRTVTNASRTCTTGPRVKGELLDFVLRRKWLITQDCERPQAPWIAVASRPFVDHANSNMPGIVVLAGEQVRLFKADPDIRIELIGTALENGTAGACIRVRVPLEGSVLRGIVRTIDSVELYPLPPASLRQGAR